MKKKNLSQKAYDYLYNQIISNNYMPETAIVENDICQILNISRTPVREALKRLESEGLVYKIKDVGTLVKEITYDDIREVFEIRTLIELYALKRYINTVSDGELKALADKLDKLNKKSSVQDYYNSDRSIHNSLMSYCANNRLIRFWQEINAQVEKLRRISAATPERLVHSLEEHQKLIAAIRNRNYEEAYDCLSTHLAAVEKSVIEAKRNSYRMLND